ncbi:hypothetical protein ABZ883_36860 [Streptomyces sp. NPDC046977]|uniref:hypothetical protein n=1 Tax=Streptomyces sp. NPDC046977 TaxID=3154703 RepID=UPI0033C423F2
MKIARNVAAVAGASFALALVLGTGTAQASSTHTYSRGIVKFTSATDTIYIKDTKNDGFGLTVWVWDQTADISYLAECGISGYGKSISCKHPNYVEKHTLRFDVYGYGPNFKVINIGHFTDKP